MEKHKENDDDKRKILKYPNKNCKNEPKTFSKCLFNFSEMSLKFKP